MFGLKILSEIRKSGTLCLDSHAYGVAFHIHLPFSFTKDWKLGRKADTLLQRRIFMGRGRENKWNGKKNLIRKGFRNPSHVKVSY